MTELATFGGGCFWCTEAVFQQLRGVNSVVSGYTGGHTDSPTYKDICSGRTGHAEVIQIGFDPTEISYADLVAIHLATHDPTTPNRQGADVGTQYRSAIYTHSPEQAELANRVLDELAPAFSEPITTEVGPLGPFYPAEAYHQNYYNTNPGAGYCQAVISPKLQKARKLLQDRLK
jgi:methionine-S-sulfoxide reductase